MTALSRSTVILSLLIALVAANSASSGEWYEGGFLKITQILVHDDSLEVMLEGNVRDERIFRLYSSEPNYQVKAAALLSAYYAGHEVSVYYSGDLESHDTRLHRFKVRR